MKPAWPTVSAWLISVALVALGGLAFAQSSEWSEAKALRCGAALLAVCGVGFVLSGYSPDRPALFRYFVRLARRKFRLSGILTGGEPRVAGWLCFALAALAALVALVSFFALG